MASFLTPFPAPSLPPPGGLAQPLLRIRNEFGVGSGQRETRLELATSSLEGMCSDSYSESPRSHFMSTILGVLKGTCGSPTGGLLLGTGTERPSTAVFPPPGTLPRGSRKRVRCRMSRVRRSGCCDSGRDACARTCPPMGSGQDQHRRPATVLVARSVLVEADNRLRRDLDDLCPLRVAPGREPLPISRSIIPDVVGASTSTAGRLRRVGVPRCRDWPRPTSLPPTPRRRQRSPSAGPARDLGCSPAPR